MGPTCRGSRPRCVVAIVPAALFVVTALVGFTATHFNAIAVNLSAQQNASGWHPLPDKNLGLESSEYQLACSQYPFTVGAQNYTVIVGYHVGMMNNWRNIVHDQLFTMDRCGLGNVLSVMYVTFSNNNSNNTGRDLRQILGHYAFGHKARIRANIGLQPVEGLALNTIHSHCTSQGDERVTSSGQSEIVVFYMNTLGSSRWTQGWENLPERTRGYRQKLAWRKYLEHFTIERPQLCIDILLQGGSYTCGVHWIRHMFLYAGNIWASKCSYLKTLESIEMKKDLPQNKRWRFVAENWLSGGASNETVKSEFRQQIKTDPVLRSKFVSLHNPSLPRGVRTLYGYYLSPAVYSNQSITPHDAWGGLI